MQAPRATLHCAVVSSYEELGASHGQPGASRFTVHRLVFRLFYLRLLLDVIPEMNGSRTSPAVAPPVGAPALGCFSALEMLRVEAGLPSMGVDIRSSHSAPQAGLARLLSLYKVRQRVFLGSEFLAKQLAVPPNVRRVGFLVGGPIRLQRAERIQRQLEQQPLQQHQRSFFAVSEEEEPVETCFPLGGCVVLSHCQRRPIGVVTSVTWSPQLQCRVAQGLVLYEFARHREVSWMGREHRGVQSTHGLESCNYPAYLLPLPRKLTFPCVQPIRTYTSLADLQCLHTYAYKM